MNSVDKNDKFSIYLHIINDAASLSCDTEYAWYVTSLLTGDELYSFSGTGNEDGSGTSEKGTRNVSFANEQHKLIVDYFDGHREYLELPADVLFGDDNTHIVLQFAGGRIETRRRCLAIAISESGEPFEITPLIKK